MIIGHQKQWEFLVGKSKLNQLSHAYMFTGPESIGKKKVAIELIKFLNCQDKKKDISCGKCVNCIMIEKNAFPDLMVISASNEKDPKFGEGGEIKIAQIRDAQNFISYKPYYGLFKAIIVDNSEKMNIEAQNCFLKTLEEPKGNTLIFLISSKPDMLLPTISSRCQRLKFTKPKDLPLDSEKVKLDKEILENIVKATDSNLAQRFNYVKSIDFEKQKLEDIIRIIQTYLRELLLVEAGIEKKTNNKLQNKKYSIEKIKNIIKLTEDINNKLLFTNLNQKLALEVILMQF